MENKLLVSPSPHVRAEVTTASIMMNVCAAMIPAAVVAVLVFGVSALITLMVSVASCVGCEYIYRKITKQPQTVGDWSAVVTGILIAFNVPANLPVYMLVIAAFVAIIVTKQWFGGIGDNFANPAIVARIFLLTSFTSAMTTWPDAMSYASNTMDTMSGATPLAILTTGGTVMDAPNMLNMLLGVRGGSLGETASIALLIGGIYLIRKKVITATIPVTLISTIFVLSALVGLNPFYMILSGGTMLGAFFMATDYSTSPISEKGKVMFAIGIGVITVIIRAYGNYPEGMSFAILLMNITAPHINNLTKKVPFGGVTQ